HHPHPRPHPTIHTDTSMVAEGLHTTRIANTIAAAHKIEMPILRAVSDMMDGVPAPEVLRQLLSRAPRAEIG
ncbi:MAG: glycerol-3-phosphate dehydrogenase, partial [Acidobacteriota bacterium]